MELSTITNIIGSIGFPIVMCLMLFNWIKDLEKQHKEETEKLTTAVNNNTQAVTILAAEISQLKGAKNDTESC